MTPVYMEFTYGSISTSRYFAACDRLKSRPERRQRGDRLDHHLHPHRRGSGARDRLVPADRAGRHQPGGCGCRDPRHLARGPHPGGVPAEPHARAAGRRRARRARRTRHAARGEHHQAPEHLGVDPAAEGGHRRAAGRGLSTSRTTRTRPSRSKTRTSARATTASRAPRSTPCCARATATAVRRCR